MDEPREAQRRRALKGHHRQADHVGRGIVDEAPHRLGDMRLHQNEIGDDHAMVGVDVAGERRQRAVRHADGDRRHVLERIRHAQQEHIHRVLHALAAGPHPRRELTARRISERPAQVGTDADASPRIYVSSARHGRGRW